MVRSDYEIIPETKKLVDYSLCDGVENDRFWKCRVLFYLLGLLSVLPVTFNVTASKYWNYKFRNLHGDSITSLQELFATFYVISATTMSVCCIYVNIYIYQKISATTRIYFSLLVLILFFSITLFFVNYDTDGWQFNFFLLSLVIGSILDFAAGCLNLATVELSSHFPGEYMGAFFSGQTVCAIIAAVFQIIALNLGSESSIISAQIYFSIAITLIFLALVCFFYIKKTRFFTHHSTKHVSYLLPDISWSTFKYYLIKFFDFNLGVALVKGITTLIAPGVTVNIKSASPPGAWSNSYFVPTSTFLLFRVFCLLGQELVTQFKWFPAIKHLILYASLRVIFIPFILLCNIWPRHHLPVIFHSDAIYIILISLFGFTDGLVYQSTLLGISKTVPHEEKILTNLLMTGVIVTAYATASFAPLIILAVI